MLQVSLLCTTIHAVDFPCLPQAAEQQSAVLLWAAASQRKIILTAFAYSQASSEVLPLHATMQYYTNQNTQF